jgi:hypothetical protein
MHLLIEPLDPGEIPVFDFEPSTCYQWDPPAWDIHGCGQRTFIGVNLDEPLTTLVDELPRRLQGLICEGSGVSPDGTLILVLRSVWQSTIYDGIVDYRGVKVVDRHGVLLLGGLAYVEGLHVGIDVGDRDLVYQVEQTCLALAGAEFDQEVPEIPEFLVRVENRRREREETHCRITSRARELLRSHLNSEQRREFDANGQFHVRGADGYDYLIVDQFQHNVFRVEAGRRVFEYCIVSKHFVPSHDQMLAQMLLLRANPSMFHEITNTWRLDEDGQRVFQPNEPAPLEIAV